MGSIIENVISNFQNNFDISFIINVNALTYVIIKTIDEFNGDKKVPTILKRGITIISAIILFAIYKANNYDNIIVLINSAIIAPVSWSWILKPIVQLLKIDYKKLVDHKK